MKKIKVLLIALVLILLGAFVGNVKAADATTVMLKAKKERPYSEDSGYLKWGKGNSIYRFLKGSYGLTRGYTMFKIEADNDTEYKRSFYCLRGRVGFGADGTKDVITDPIEYTKLGEMHSNSNNVINKYKELFNVNLNRTETINDESVNIYNAILWVLDNSYIPTDDIENGYVASEYKEELLDKVGIAKNDAVRAEITDDDIEVMQQLAIWYCANYDGQEDDISVSRKEANVANYLGLVKSIDGTPDEDSYNNNVFFQNEDGTSSLRQENLNRIYQYFINSAVEANESYGANDKREIVKEEVKFDHDIELGVTSVDYDGFVDQNKIEAYLSEYYYKIGPFSIKGNSDARNKVNVADVILEDKNENVVSRYYKNEDDIINKTYYFVDESGNIVTELTRGEKYYLILYKKYTDGFTLGSAATIPEEYKYDIEEVTLKISSSYSESTVDFYYRTDKDQPVVEIKKAKKVSGDLITTKLKEFDLSLRKFITYVDGKELTGKDSRVPNIDTTTLINGIKNRKGETEYTATYTHPKNALQVETGNKVIYTIRIYNEGELDGTATEITDYLPEGLALVPAKESKINTKYGWIEGANNQITTKYLANTTIKAFDVSKENAEEGWQKAAKGNGGLYYADVEVECIVTAQATKNDQSLRNIAEITADTGDDRDSTPGNVDINNYAPEKDNSTYQEDDDDYERLVLPGKAFDLALRKFITKIERNGKEVEFADRTPSINTKTLIDGTFKRNGKLEHTATYTHSKEPLTVKRGDIITYTLRIYNEGELNGYATEITDYIPEGLALILNYKTNFDNGWKLPKDLKTGQVMDLVGEKGFYKTKQDVKGLNVDDFTDITNLNEVQLVTGKVAITTNELKGELIKAFDSSKTNAEEGWQKADVGDGGLYYKDVEVTCLVVAENTYKDVITNVAEISEDKDENGNDIDDRDSVPNNKKDPYTENQEDDDDYEPVILKYFDLALRKFITGVETNGKVKEVTSRVPSLSIDKETGNILYTHPKEEAPVAAANNDVIIYTLRVYNEGTIEGYAEEIKDDIPDGLEYLPEHAVNKSYEWIMIDKDGKETKDAKEAVSITTDYLSKAKETEERNNLLKAFDASKELGEGNPDYRDVKVAFRIVEPNTSDRVLVNSAQISKDSDDDEDSVPDEWNPGEDDQDREYVYVKYFDLSLLKWVTRTVVTVDGKTTTTNTGFKPNIGKTETTGIRDNNAAEPIAKVELDKKKLSKTTVKFVYKIRVTNEGEIAGYATELTDYIPEGLEFVQSDNTKFGWKKDGEDKVTTRALEKTLLQPGESAEVEIVFKWKNSSKNLGLKTNIAEISEDYNENNSKDIDSVPDNKKNPYEKEQEDDDDFALVILSLKTGKGATYTILTITIISVLAVGIYLIKRYVLNY